MEGRGPFRTSFGDNVVVLSTPETDRLGLAGRRGQVYGETTPSVTRVEVVGGVDLDRAINVYFNETDERVWFQEALLGFIDHGAGTEISIDGASVAWVRTDTGEWLERPLSDGPVARPWWKFWG